VYACDVSPSMVERGRSRSHAEGLQISWRLADVQDLPYPDEHFDAVLSSFGASHARVRCAPRPSSCGLPGPVRW
jgi:ubiquinone/menaquinone biosynthesis C-methylase UbiE